MKKLLLVCAFALATGANLYSATAPMAAGAYPVRNPDMPLPVHDVGGGLPPVGIALEATQLKVLGAVNAASTTLNAVAAGINSNATNTAAVAAGVNSLVSWTAQVSAGVNSNVTWSAATYGFLTTTAVGDDVWNTGTAVGIPQENVTALTFTAVGNDTVWIVNLTTTAGNTCPAGINAYVCAPTANQNISAFVGNLTFTPSVNQLLVFGTAVSGASLHTSYPNLFRGAKAYITSTGAGNANAAVSCGCSKLK